MYSPLLTPCLTNYATAYIPEHHFPMTGSKDCEQDVRDQPITTCEGHSRGEFGAWLTVKGITLSHF